jgi:Domain of unknown function (DUF5916)
MTRFSAVLKWILVPLWAFCSQAMAQITVDGVLDEPEWQQAQVFTDFVVTEPMTAAASPYATEARFYTDDDGIYIGFSNYQPADVPRIQRRFARDEFIQSDRNIVGIDFDGTGLSAYDFTVGIANSQTDGTYRGEKGFSDDWDGTWYSQTSQTDDYWYVEIFIPWSVAPMSDPGTVRKRMKVYFGRFIWAESIRLAYPLAAFSRPTFVSDWDEIEVDFKTTQTLDWFPYVTSEYDIEDEESELKAGMDVVWRPNSAAQFTGTLNPDFGQVESDELEVNFTAFETFFTEKRPFFTENSTLFSNKVPFGDRQVHTRRIGAAPDVGENESTDIDAGAKYSHYGDYFDLGLFAVTEDDSGEARGRDYLATRVQGRTGNMVLGHTLTYVDRPTLDREATVNSVDWDWQEGGMRLRGQGFYSDVEQDANDANDNLDRDEQDWAGWNEVDYRPDDEHRWQALVYYYGDEYNMNDMGFLKRNDWMRVVGLHTRDYTSHPNWPALRSSYWQLKLAYEENNSGDSLQEAVDFVYLWKMESTEEFSVNAYIEVADPWDDRITRGNGNVKLDPQHAFEATYLNPRGGDINYSLSYFVERSGADKPAHEILFSPTWYLHDRVTLTGEVSFASLEEWLLWDPDSQQLALYEADVYDVNLRMDWFPDTRQEVRIKFQWIGVDADAVAGQAIGADGRLSPSAIPVSDFSLSDTAVQIRYRYQLAPLSDIFLVYERGGFSDEDKENTGAGDLLSNGWDDVTREMVLAKIRYRF